MYFFAVRAQLPSGDWCLPWTLWAEARSKAVDLFEKLEPDSAFGDLQIRMLPQDQAATFYGQPVGSVPVQHNSWTDLGGPTG